jgi:hypothetical protein
MTTATYDMYPSDSLFDHLAGAHNPLNNYSTYQPNTNASEAQVIQVIEKNDVRVGQHWVTELGYGTSPAAPSASALITDAYFSVDTLNMIGSPSQTGTLEAVVSLVDRDGLWDSPSVGNIWGAGTPTPDFKIDVKNTSSTTIAGPTTTASTDSFFHLYTNLTAAPLVQAGQTIETTTTGDLGEVDVTMYRGSGAGTMKLEMVVYRANADNGTDDTPDTGAGIKATSDEVAWTSLTQDTAGAVVTFSFSGAEQITITDGERYVYVVRYKSGTGGIKPWMMNIVQNGSFDGDVQFHGYGDSFSTVYYPQSQDLPWLYEADDTTIDTAAFGSITDPFDWPSHPTPYGVTPVEIHPPDMKYLIQEWIEDAAYATDELIAFQVNPTADAGFGVQRSWSDVRLILEWRDRQIFVG